MEEKLQEQEEVLTKEEVLSRSRKENRSGDERERGFLSVVPWVSCITGFVAILVLEIIACVLNLPSIVIRMLNMLPTTMLSAQSVCYAFVYKRKRVFFAVLGAIAVVLTIITWVLFAITVAGTSI